MILPLLLAILAARADDPVADCGGPCGEDVACALSTGRCLVEREAWTQALEVLKAARASVTAAEAGTLARLLSLAYAGAGNDTWARRVLADQVRADPTDAETRTWAAWRALDEGDLTGARAWLGTREVPGPLGEREALLRATLADLEGHPDEARERLLRPTAPLLPGDEVLKMELRRRVLGDTGNPYSARIQGSAGYTSNAVQSAPQDLGSGAAENTGSPVASLDGVLRYEPWSSPGLRPVAEARVKGLLPVSGPTRSSAWLDLGGRAGVEAGPRTATRGRLLYSLELLGVNSGDAYSGGTLLEDDSWSGQRWYMEAHRAEIEADLGERVQVFGGAGRRLYRDTPRTRTEGDVGAALVLPLGGGWNLTGVLSGRLQDARLPEWDLVGGSALLRVAAPLPRSGLVLARALVLADRFDLDTPAGRRDWTWGLQVAPWTRPLGGVRWGLSWTWTDRTSTDEAWSYTDHRVLVEARWQPSWGHEPAPLAPVGPDYLPLPYGIGSAADSGLDRVQDLLRQEDSARRGSSCVD
ncbi:MAG: hypothetical protein JXB39_12170 [Deltaproteobacteria bacterium]|nr:hypothetical protein [Deltaproteobacteria bacterium]